MAHLLLIYDDEKKYAKKLADYLNSRDGFPFEVMFCTNKTELYGFLEISKVDVFLVRQGLMSDLPIDAHRYEIISLIGSEGKNGGSADWIYKYQNCDVILKEILRICSKKEELKRLISRKRAIELLIFYSPNNRNGQTSLALSIARILGKNDSVAYLNLEGYSGLEKILNYEFSRDLSDLIYEMDNQPNCENTILDSVYRLDNIDIFPIMRNHKDLYCISEKEWESFFSKIEDNSEYSYLIVDLSDCVPCVEELLLNSSKVIMPYLSGSIDGAKRDQFWDALSQEKKEMLAHKMIEICISDDFDFGDNSIVIPSSKLMDYAGKIVKEHIMCG